MELIGLVHVGLSTLVGGRIEVHLSAIRVSSELVVVLVLLLQPGVDQQRGQEAGGNDNGHHPKGHPDVQGELVKAALHVGVAVVGLEDAVGDGVVTAAGGWDLAAGLDALTLGPVLDAMSTTALQLLMHIVPGRPDNGGLIHRVVVQDGLLGLVGEPLDLGRVVGEETCDQDRGDEGKDAEDQDERAQHASVVASHAATAQEGEETKEA